LVRRGRKKEHDDEKVVREQKFLSREVLIRDWFGENLREEVRATEDLSKKRRV
jgi:hypothetical protein